MKIRDATPADEAVWRGLWAAYLAFYAVELPEAQTVLTWGRIIGEGPMNLRLAEEDGRVVGFALWNHHPSSWAMADDLYLEDLFVDPQARGRGLGRALIADLFAIARTRGFSRVWWMTEEGNAAARKLYDTMSGYDGHIRYRTRLAP